ncbi:hypothetical protein ACLKA6_007366 [Drosophila palustris]
MPTIATKPGYDMSQAYCEDFMAQGHGARTLEGYGPASLHHCVNLDLCVFIINEQSAPVEALTEGRAPGQHSMA